LRSGTILFENSLFTPEGEDEEKSNDGAGDVILRERHSLAAQSDMY
jgi:hypothetical protein